MLLSRQLKGLTKKTNVTIHQRKACTRLCAGFSYSYYLRSIHMRYTGLMPQKYCSNCGEQIPANVNFCSYCGSAQTTKENHARDARKANPPQAAQAHARSHTLENDKCIEKRRLCQRALWSFFLNYLGKTGALLLLFMVGVIFEPLLFGTILGLYVVILYISAAIVHRNYYFEVNESAFRKEHGVIHKTDVTIPFNRIQNVNITRSLSDRLLGLARIDIESAGSSATTSRNVAGGSRTKAEGHLPGVTVPQAEEVHDLLLERFAEFQGAGNDRANP